MIRKNDIVRLTIEKFGGENGIGHIDGLTVFVRNALPGETVEARVEKVQKSFAFLKTLRVLTPSAERRVPPCPVYEKCGGCQTQHMSYALSLEMKRERVADVQLRLGGIQLDVPPVLGMEDPWHYRNKISMPVGLVHGQVETGYYLPRSHQIIPVRECPVAMRETGPVLALCKQWMAENGIPPYDEGTGEGLVRHIMVRVSRDGQVMAVVISSALLPHTDRLVAMLREGVPGLNSVCLNINTRRDNVILGQETRVLFGSGFMTDRLCGLVFRVSPLSFFQINPTQTEVLYNLALEYAALTGKETVCDLYCGAGTISLLLARRAAKVIGIEAVEAAVENARENAERNGIRNCEFIAGPAEVILPRLAQQGLKTDVCVLDPPRKGCEKPVLEAIAASGADRIVYVACDPATQARDIAILVSLGYQAVKTQSVDMFCQTAHVESVVALNRAWL